MHPSCYETSQQERRQPFSDAPVRRLRDASQRRHDRGAVAPRPHQFMRSIPGLRVALARFPRVSARPASKPIGAFRQRRSPPPIGSKAAAATHNNSTALCLFETRHPSGADPIPARDAVKSSIDVERETDRHSCCISAAIAAPTNREIIWRRLKRLPGASISSPHDSCIDDNSVLPGFLRCGFVARTDT